MNYRHIFHAGNFADVVKHLVFRLCLSYLQQKEKGLFVLDAFAGTGLYDLSADQALRTGEFRDGIARLMESTPHNADIADFRDFCAARYAQGLYAGSPLMAAEMLRPQDRLVANELHPEDALTLGATLRRFRNASVTTLDAYESIRAHIPPPERRGIILIDPPFEKKNEFDLLVRQMREWKKRWETGCYLIWYPIKAGQPIDALYDAARATGFKDIYAIECLLRPRDTAEGLNGCGVLILNTPFGIAERMRALQEELALSLGISPALPRSGLQVLSLSEKS